MSLLRHFTGRAAYRSRDSSNFPAALHGGTHTGGSSPLAEAPRGTGDTGRAMRAPSASQQLSIMSSLGTGTFPRKATPEGPSPVPTSRSGEHFSLCGIQGGGQPSMAMTVTNYQICGHRYTPDSWQNPAGHVLHTLVCTKNT